MSKEHNQESPSTSLRASKKIKKPPYAKASEDKQENKKKDNNISDVEILESKYKRALADYQNLLKRTAIEKQEYVKYANEQLLHEILPVYDNLKLALKHSNESPSDANAVMEGVKYVLSQFKTILDNLGIKEIKTVGEKFDHHIMEAIEKKATDDKKKDGIVESEIMPGYILESKVIRAARVIVYKFKK